MPGGHPIAAGGRFGHGHGLANGVAIRIIAPMSRTTRALLSLALVLPMSLGTSATLAQSPGPVAYPLDTEIALTQMAGTDVAADAGITALFGSGGSLSGSGGCNSYSATWDSDGTTLTVGAIAATRMACDPAVNTLESEYLGLLQVAATWSLEGTTVTVTTSAGSTLVYGGDTDGPALVGEWQLSTFGGTAVPNGIIATAVFGADGSVTGSGGCNTFSGTYTASDTSLTISRLAVTSMFCEAAGEIEPAYLDTLQATTGWSVVGDTLTIESTLPLVFTSGIAATGSLTGQDWLLATMGGQPVEPSLGTSATFADDGTVSGSGGCNGYDSTYTIDGDSISIAPVAATRMACAPEANESESSFFAAMEGATSFTVSGSDLVIATVDGSSLEFSTSTGATPSATPSTVPASGEPGTSAAPAGSIVGSWQMTEMMGMALPGGMLDIDITFADDGTFSGNGGCNEYTGTWSLSGTTLTLGSLVLGTGATCDATTQGIEQSFFNVITFLDTAEVTDGKLVLGSQFSSSVTFAFEAAD